MVCGQRQGFNQWNPINWLVSPAYAAEDCTIYTSSGVIHLGIKTYEECKQAIRAYLAKLPRKSQLKLAYEAGAFGNIFDSNPKNMARALLWGFTQLDKNDDGELFKSYQAGLGIAWIKYAQNRDQLLKIAYSDLSEKEKIARLTELGMEGTISASLISAIGISGRGAGAAIKRSLDRLRNGVRGGPNGSPNVPGRVQSRVNLRTGDNNSGWVHVQNRHFGGNNSQSQFTLSQSNIRDILQSNRVVSTPVTEIKIVNGSPTFVRRVDVGQQVGTVRQAHGGGTTSNLYVQTDGAGNLITAFPIP